MVKYGIQKKITGSFASVIERVKHALKLEGFGVLTEVNVTETFKNKLQIDYPNYIILGVCHPQSAYKALEIEKELGLLLPCNVIVYEENETIIVAAIRPTVAMQMVQSKLIVPIAIAVEEKLKKVIDQI